MLQESVKQYEPFWDKWYIEERLGAGSFGEVYKIKREEYGETYYSALKIISIPRDKSELNEVTLACGSIEKTMTYYDNIRQSIVKEVSMMERFKGKTNIVSYEDHEILPKEGGKRPGYDIFIRMELLEDLQSVATKNSALFRDNKEIIKIGKDMCRALKICHAQNIIHRDIKMGNIFRSVDGDYKLGDFGIARSFDDSNLTMSVKGTFDYMAPEVYHHEHYDFRADVYSLGMLLYYLLNAFRGPFLPNAGEALTADKKDEALFRRMQGEKLPRPRFASERLSEVVLKACEFAPEGRYSSVDELYDALSRLTDEELLRIDDPMPEVDELCEEKTEILIDNKTEILIKPEKVGNKPEIVPSNESGSKQKKKGLYMIIAIALLLVCVSAVVVLQIKKGQDVAQEETAKDEENEIEQIEEIIPITPTCEETVVAEVVEPGTVLKSIELAGEFNDPEDGSLVEGSIMWEQEDFALEISGDFCWIFYPEDAEKYTTVQGTTWVTVLHTETVTGIDEVKAIEDKKSLVDVDLSKCNLKNLNILEGAENLKYVVLDGNKIKSVKMLKNCPKLEFLSLENNKSFSDVTPVLEMKNLKAIALNGTKVSKSDKKKLKKMGITLMD